MTGRPVRGSPRYRSLRQALGRSLRTGVEEALHLFLPPACVGCRAPLPPGDVRICEGCRTRLRPPAHPRCVRCHAPRGTGLPASRPCTECAEWPGVLRRARSAVVLAPPADALVHALKYDGWPELAGPMSERMVAALGRGDVGEGAVVVPVPTTPGRARARGYNQAELLARGVSERLGCPLVLALERPEDGGTQVALHRSERRANVQGAFRPSPSRGLEVRGRSVVLVDDVLTTGATACSAAESLAQTEATGVLLLTFARALPGASDS